MDFPGKMLLRLEEKETKNQIPKTTVSKGRENRQVTKPEDAILPPDAAGGDGNAILIYKNILSKGIQRVSATGKDRFTD